MRRILPALTLALILLIPLAGVARGAQTAAEDPVQKLTAQAGPGVLALVVYDKDKKEIARGSAVVLAKDLAVANYHTVSAAAAVTAFNAKKKEVDVLGIVAVDKARDLVLLKIDGKVQPLVPAAEAFREGLKILALGGNESGAITASNGALRGTFDLGQGTQAADVSLSIPDGFAGGGVFTEDGKLIGVLVAPERRLKLILPIAAASALAPSAKPQPFKTWTPEDYAATAEGAWLIGRMATWLDETLTAQRNLEKVTRLQSGNLEAWVLLASVYARQRDLANSSAAYKKIIELDPQNSAAYFGLGEAQVRLQKPQDAVLNLEKALALDPSRTEALMFLGNAYQDAREWTKAADAYEKYLATGRAQDPALIARSLGDCRMEANEFDKAAAAYGEAAKTKPDDLYLAYKQGQAYERGGKLEQAETIYKMLAEKSPKDAINYYRGIMAMYDKVNNSVKAIEAAKKVVELNPKDEQALYNLGFLHQKVQNYGEAIAAFRQAIEVKPDYDFAWFQIGYCYYVQKKYTEALKPFQKNVELVPDHFYGWMYIGMCYMQNKQYVQAMDPMKKASDLKPDDGTALFNLGIIYLNLRDKYSAQEVAKKLQGIDANLAAKLKGYIK